MIGIPITLYSSSLTPEALVAYPWLMPPGWLTIENQSGRRRAVLHTVIHRRPRDLTISLATAARLAAGGVPLVIRGVDDARRRNVA